MRILTAYTLLLLIGCQPRLQRQARVNPFSKLASRPAPEGTISQESAVTYTPHIDRTFLERGRDRYNIYCSVCHGFSGDGDGMAVQRGLHGPVNFHDERIRKLSAVEIAQVIAEGRGAMFGMSNRIPKADRWAIVSYVRVLQLSRLMSKEKP